jgi:hypothetical protein
MHIVIQRPQHSPGCQPLIGTQKQDEYNMTAPMVYFHLDCSLISTERLTLVLNPNE